MTAKIRKIERVFEPLVNSHYDNLLVSGCSFTFNNSEKDACSWPYYLRDLSNFNEVHDCSQSGAGSNHIFNSIVYELETNKSLSPENTLVVVCWSGLERFDVIAQTEITKSWHFMSNYHFNDKFSTLTLAKTTASKEPLDNLSNAYSKLIDWNAQIIQSALHIIALREYLRSQNYNYVFAQYHDLSNEINLLDSELRYKLLDCFDALEPIGVYAKEFESCGHPTPDSYLDWTRNCLLPYLMNKYPARFKKI